MSSDIHLIECCCKHELPQTSGELLSHEREEALLEDTETERADANDGIDPGPYCSGIGNSRTGSSEHDYPVQLCVQDKGHGDLWCKTLNFIGAVGQDG